MNTDIKILLADDEEQMRKLHQAYLKKLGFENVIVACDGKEAWSKLKEGMVDLIISDWDMPQMTGIEFLQKVRQYDEYKKIPFLMLTAHTDKESVMDAIKEGVSNYIVKPLTKEKLEQKMKELLEK